MSVVAGLSAKCSSCCQTNLKRGKETDEVTADWSEVRVYTGLFDKVFLVPACALSRFSVSKLRATTSCNVTRILCRAIISQGNLNTSVFPSKKKFKLHAKPYYLFIFNPRWRGWPNRSVWYNVVTGVFNMQGEWFHLNRDESLSKGFNDYRRSLGIAFKAPYSRSYLSRQRFCKRYFLAEISGDHLSEALRSRALRCASR